MGRALGDTLVRGERELRPSEAFIHLIYDELPPEAYPEAAIEELRKRSRRVYREKSKRRHWLIPFGRSGNRVATVARFLIQVVFFLFAPPTCRNLEVEPPTHVAFIRALGSASAMG
jgi:hypothetical protein